MRVYLSARYGRRAEMQAAVEQIQLAGHMVTSTWVWHADLPEQEDALPPHVLADFESRWSIVNMHDVLRSNILLAFTDLPFTEADAERSVHAQPHIIKERMLELATAGRGGRHVETGIALGVGIKVLVVGPRENAFHRYQAVRRVGGLKQAIEHMEQLHPLPIVDC